MDVKIELDEAKILKTLVDTLASIVDETEIVFTAKAMTIKAMDQSRICLLQLEMKKGSFSKYECTKKTSIGVNLGDFNKIMNRSSQDDEIELNYNEADQKIKIKMKGGSSKRVRTFSLALLDLDIEEIPMDNLLELEQQSSFIIDTDYIVEAIKDGEIYSDILNFVIKEDNLTLSSNGTIGEMEYEINSEDLTEFEVKSQQLCAYALQFLKNITKIFSIVEQLKISLTTGFPLRFDLTLLNNIEMIFFLAPRVEEVIDEEGDIDEF